MNSADRTDGFFHLWQLTGFLNGQCFLPRVCTSLGRSTPPSEAEKPASKIKAAVAVIHLYEAAGDGNSRVFFSLGLKVILDAAKIQTTSSANPRQK